MSAATRVKLCQGLTLITGATALCVGLGALQVNVLGALHLEGFEQMLRYLVGIAGLASLVMVFRDCSKGKC